MTRQEAQRNHRRLVSRGTHRFVGQFFVETIKRILELETPVFGDGQVDLVYPGGSNGSCGRRNIAIEVKATGSRPWIIPIEQLEGHLETIRGFPGFQDLIYCLVIYSNPRRLVQKRKRSALSRQRGKTEVENFLAQNIVAIYVLGEKIINALRKWGNLRRGLLPGKRSGELMFKIHHREVNGLDSLQKKDFLSGLLLNPRSWTIENRSVKLPSKDTLLGPVEVLITFVLEKRVLQGWRPAILTTN